MGGQLALDVHSLVVLGTEVTQHNVDCFGLANTLFSALEHAVLTLIGCNSSQVVLVDLGEG